MSKSKCFSIPLIVFAMLFSLSACDSVAAFLRGLDRGILSEEGLIPDGTAFFVGKNGNDNNPDGLSAAKPFKTFDKALNEAIASNTIKRVAVIGTLTATESLSSDNDSTFLIAATTSDEVTIIGHGRNAVLKAASGKRVLILPNGSTTSVPIVFSNITLSGGAADNGAGLYIGSYREVTLKSGVTITNCEATSYGGGGVFVSGTFTMNGGDIQDNSAPNGGGVLVYGGTFTMNGGNIQDNSATNGGGVFGNGGTFTMNDGNIQDNSATNYGGGVYAITFTMNGGNIQDNSATNYGGGGIYVSGGSFQLTGGVIQNNFTKVSAGGGVYVAFSATVELSGGTIQNNIAGIDVGLNGSDNHGGGVYATTYSTVALSGDCVIQKNTATYGGGVYVSSAEFTKTGGIIYGKNGGDNANRASADGNGHAVYDAGYSRFRDTTADATVALDDSNAANWNQ